MFIGHLGVGLMLKKVEPRLNLGVLLFASLMLDILLGMFILCGLEHIHVPDAYGQMHYLNFIFPFSHGLVAAILWSLVAFGVTYAFFPAENGAKLRASALIAAAVAAHWIGDWIEHPSQLPLVGNDSQMLGLGLWDQLETALGLEIALIAVGMLLYFKTATHASLKSRWAIVVFMTLLTVIAVVGQSTVTEAPQENVIAASMIIQSIVVCIVAGWFDRKTVKSFVYSY